MSKRLQVLVPEDRYAEIARAAARRGVTVSAWVRMLLDEAVRGEPVRTATRKLAALRAGLRHEFPTSDIDEILEQIEGQYLER